MTKKIFQCIKKPQTKIACLLESTDLWGGVNVVFRLVEALQKEGYYATIRSLRFVCSILNCPISNIRVNKSKRYAAVTFRKKFQIIPTPKG